MIRYSRIELHAHAPIWEKEENVLFRVGRDFTYGKVFAGGRIIAHDVVDPPKTLRIECDCLQAASPRQKALVGDALLVLVYLEHELSPVT